VSFGKLISPKSQSIGWYDTSFSTMPPPYCTPKIPEDSGSSLSTI